MFSIRAFRQQAGGGTSKWPLHLGNLLTPAENGFSVAHQDGMLLFSLKESRIGLVKIWHSVFHRNRGG